MALSLLDSDGDDDPTGLNLGRSNNKSVGTEWLYLCVYVCVCVCVCVRVVATVCCNVVLDPYAAAVVCEE